MPTPQAVTTAGAMFAWSAASCYALHGGARDMAIGLVLLIAFLTTLFAGVDERCDIPYWSVWILLGELVGLAIFLITANDGMGPIAFVLEGFFLFLAVRVGAVLSVGLRSIRDALDRMDERKRRAGR